MSTGCRLLPPKKQGTPSSIDGRYDVRQESGFAKPRDSSTPGGGGDDAGCTCSRRPPRTQGFTQFIASLWPEAQAAGVPRAVFEAETRGLEPDYKLPDLILPGRPATGAPSQAEFVQVPADYVKEASIVGWPPRASG